MVLDENPIARYLDDPNVCEDKFSEEAGSDGFLDSVVKVTGILNQNKILVGR